MVKFISEVLRLKLVAPKTKGFNRDYFEMYSFLPKMCVKTGPYQAMIGMLPWEFQHVAPGLVPPERNAKKSEER